MSRRSSAPPRRFQDMLSAANAGDEASLRALYHSISHENLGEGFIDVIESNVSIEPPTQNDEDYTRRANAGTLSLLMLFKISTSSKSGYHQSTRTALATFYFRNLDAICGWIKFSLRSGIGFVSGPRGSVEVPAQRLELYMTYAMLFPELMSHLHPDPGTSPLKASLSSPTFCRLVYQMWTDQEEDVRGYFTAMGQDQACSIASLMAKALKDGSPEDWGILLEILGADGFSGFAKATLKRVQYASRGLSDGTLSSHGFNMGRISTICTIVDVLKNIIPYTPALFEALTRLRFLKVVASSVKIATQVAVKSEKPARIIHALYPTILHLLRLALEARSRCSRNWADLVSGGFLDALSCLTNNLSGESQRRMYMVLSKLGGYTLYPVVLQECNRAYPKGPPATGMDSTNWVQFWGNIMNRVEVLQPMLDQGADRVIPRICDNVQCQLTQGERILLGSEASRECSGCCSVVYCSGTCQTADWSRMHHSECLPAKRDRASRRLVKGSYSHSSRAYHTAMLETLFKADYVNPDTVTAFDYATTGDEKVVHRSVDEWWNGEGMDDLNPPDYLFPRFEALMERYRKSEGKLVLSELILPPLGKESVMYLAVLLRQEDGRFQSVFSAARCGPLSIF